jgi:hypothetical protein
MSNLATAVARAQRVTAPRAAARLYNDLEFELALGADGTEERYEQGEEALRVLQERFPDIDRKARQITDPPNLSRAADRGGAAAPRQAPAAASQRAATPGRRTRRRTHWRRWALVVLLIELHRRRPRSGWKRWGMLAPIGILALGVLALVLVRSAYRVLLAAVSGLATLSRQPGSVPRPPRVHPTAPRAPRWPSRRR